MKDAQSRSRAEIIVSLFFILVCIVVLWESRLIPPGTFEPLGSAPIPRYTALLIIGLCLLTLYRAFQTLRQVDGNNDVTESVETGVEESHSPRYVEALAILGLTIVYCLVLHSKTVSFALTTCVFLFIAIGLLIRFTPRSMIVVTVISLVMGFGCQYVFTRVFVVDLPGAF